MPSFDVVSEVDRQEVRNAVDQANREVTGRFDFKGTDARFELSDEQIVLHAESEFQLQQMMDILLKKLVKRDVDVACLDMGEPQLQLRTARQDVTVRQGISTELAKRLVKDIKQAKLKAQAQIQGDQVRVSGKKRDDLQNVIAMLRGGSYDMPLQYINFRD